MTEKRRGEYHEAEAAVVAAAVMRNETAWRADLVPGDFGHATARAAWIAILECLEDGEAADPLTIETRTAGRVTFEWLAEADGLVASAENIEHYAKIVRDGALERRVMQLAFDVASKNYANLSGPALLEMVQNGVERLATGQDSGGYVSANEMVRDVMEAMEKGAAGRGLLTGVEEWDQYGEIDRGDMLIVGADTSMGKSQLLGWLQLRYLEQGQRVLLLSTESKSRKVGRRALSYMSGVNSRDIRRGEISMEDMRRLVDGASTLAGRPLWVCDSIFDADAMASFVRHMVARHGVTTVLVDHIHHMTVKGIRDPLEKVAYCAERLSMTAAQADVYMVAAAQTGKEAGKEKREATSHDLYYSHRIAQCAQAIVMITRLARYSNKANPTEMILRWDKVRDGQAGKEYWKWDDVNGLVVGPSHR